MNFTKEQLSEAFVKHLDREKGSFNGYSNKRSDEMDRAY